MTYFFFFEKGINVNKSMWKETDSTWFGEYAGYKGLLWLDNHLKMRTLLRELLLMRVGFRTPEFKAAFDKVTNEASVLSGSRTS
jgi:hypothetical protein